MAAYSFDEPEFTIAREKRKEKENNKQRHQKFTTHNLPEQQDPTVQPLLLSPILVVFSLLSETSVLQLGAIVKITDNIEFSHHS